MMKTVLFVTSQILVLGIPYYTVCPVLAGTVLV